VSATEKIAPGGGKVFMFVAGQKREKGREEKKRKKKKRKGEKEKGEKRKGKKDANM
jgi:hypothetical protein